MQVCLTGGLQEDNCALGSQSCWQNDTLDVDACIDTYRGYKCKCPEGASHNYQSPELYVTNASGLINVRLAKQKHTAFMLHHDRDFSCSTGTAIVIKGFACRAHIQCSTIASAFT